MSEELDEAIRLGDEQLVQELLDEGFTADAVVNGHTPLTEAVSCRETKIVKLLLAAGVNVNGCNEVGDTALHCAAIHGQVPIAKALLTNGADAEATGRDGKTPLQVAIFHEQLRLTKCLIDHGANVNNAGIPRSAGFQTSSPLRMSARSKGKRHLEIMHMLLEAGAVVNESPRCALMEAAADGSVEMVAALLAAGAEVNAVDEHGWSPLMYAASSNRADSVKLLLEAGADASVKLPAKDADFPNMTAIEIASADGSRKVVELLENAV